MATVPLTTPPALTEREQFLAERKTGIGGSDIFHLLNEPQYGKGCARWLMYEKLGIPADFDVPMNSGVLKRGTKMEQLIADEYEESTGRKLRRQPLRRNPEHPWAIVHMDRQVLAGSGRPELNTVVTETGAAEIKSYNDWTYRIMQRQGVLPATMLQVQHTMLVSGYRWTAFIGMRVSDFELQHIDVPRDEQIIDIIKRAGDTFWAQKEKGELPSQLPDEQDVRCLACSHRKTCRGLDADVAAAEAAQQAGESGKIQLVQIDSVRLEQNLLDRAALRAEIKELTDLLDDSVDPAIKAELESLAGAGNGYFAWQTGQFKGYWKQGAWSGFDQTKHKAEHPDCHESYMIKGRPAKNKTLLVYPKQA